MAARPICEPVELAPGASVVVDRVTHPASSPSLGRLLHFHDVSELVLFDAVDGWFFADGKRYRLDPGSIAFVPSMRHHDFALDAGAKSWRLVQVDPYIVEQIAVRPEGARLARPFCAHPKASEFARLAMLAEWLQDAAAADARGPLVGRLVELLLTAVAQAPEARSSESGNADADVDRLLPALDRLRRDPGAAIPLPAAATMCSLSPAYFSRRFKQVFGMNFTDYARAYRLHVAARRIVGTRRPVSEIAYDLGFSSPSHFTQRFHERFGMAPRDYRRGARGRGE
ncbi:AraC family transcriptional regulator [Sphingomonas gilva]|uniref:AraC family transcriptional regulator n=1 Tax=Sphingomonas gilva TaxID=2305907 RepID=A0A396RT76_9SPHN|nr:AraC family transcriptional regulator [Sphingomonas gilva]RHW19296.1 AraC family transcriptional regulator [Sphingomonas gilva]